MTFRNATMMDLTDDFRAAYEKRASWSHELALQVLQRIAQGCDGTVDWEQGDEEWGRVLDGDVVVALVRARWPLVLVLESIDVGQQSSDTVVITYTDIEAPDFRIDPSWLCSAIERTLTENVNYESISISDLWWATVS